MPAPLAMTYHRRDKLYTIGSLFSGIGGLELGLERAGFGPTLWQVEIDDYATKVLEKHWPGVARNTTRLSLPTRKYVSYEDYAKKGIRISF